MNVAKDTKRMKAILYRFHEPNGGADDFLDRA